MAATLTTTPNAVVARPRRWTGEFVLAVLAGCGSSISFSLLFSAVPLYAAATGGEMGAGLSTGGMVLATVAAELSQRQSGDRRYPAHDPVDAQPLAAPLLRYGQHHQRPAQDHHDREPEPAHQADDEHGDHPGGERQRQRGTPSSTRPAPRTSR
jgi:hypothetical protein